jgi:hypothetical protein
MGAGSAPERVETCARIVHACPRAARAAWGHVLADLDLDSGVRELRVLTAVIAGTEDRLTPLVHARAIAAALPDCLGLTELAGMGHMTPVEAPEVVTARIRELVFAYVPTGGATGANGATGAGDATGANGAGDANGANGTNGAGSSGVADGVDGTAEKEDVA